MGATFYHGGSFYTHDFPPWIGTGKVESRGAGGKSSHLEKFGTNGTCIRNPDSDSKPKINHFCNHKPIYIKFSCIHFDNFFKSSFHWIILKFLRNFHFSIFKESTPLKFVIDFAGPKRKAWESKPGFVTSISDFPLSKKWCEDFGECFRDDLTDEENDVTKKDVVKSAPRFHDTFNESLRTTFKSVCFQLSRYVGVKKIYSRETWMHEICQLFAFHSYHFCNYGMSLHKSR